jgi:hypothetical protein
MGQQENDDRDTEQHGDCQHQAAGDETQHCYLAQSAAERRDGALIFRPSLIINMIR